MTRSLNGRVAVVTGAGSGIGRAIALRLAEDTARIAIWDINIEGAEETARLIATGAGVRGTCLEYLENLAARLELVGLDDPAMRELRERVRCLIDAGQ